MDNQSRNHLLAGIALLVIPGAIALWFLVTGKAYVPISDPSGSAVHEQSMLVTLTDPRKVIGISLILLGIAAAAGGREICRGLNKPATLMNGALGVGALLSAGGAVMLLLGYL